MPLIEKHDRYVKRGFSFEERISSDNEVRFIDAFVDKLSLEKLSFEAQEVKLEGRPGYERQMFLKLYLYGYLNGIRSSRKLERECERNIELHWLLSGLRPNYHSISDFRKDNPKGLAKLFKLYVLYLKECELIGGETVAVDGTKIRASNSKKNNYNPKKIERHLRYIETKSKEYLEQLSSCDKSEDETERNHLKAKIARLSRAKSKYERLENELTEIAEPQVSTTDRDSRALLIHGQVVEVSYNVQTAVDEKHKLIVATHTINRNDRNALSKIALEAKANIEVESFTVLADKGYHNGRELQTTQQAGLKTVVAMGEVVNSNAHGTQPEYLVSKFRYNTACDSYTCPEGQILTTKGRWHEKKRELNVSYRFKKYRTGACVSCAVRDQCTGRQDGRREIERSEFAESVEQNAENYRQNQGLYRQRQEINEHIFGTCKRQWNYYYTNLRGLKKVNGEMALVMTVYNLKRSLNILGIDVLLEKLKNWGIDYGKIVENLKKRVILRRFKTTNDFFVLKVA